MPSTSHIGAAFGAPHTVYPVTTCHPTRPRRQLLPPVSAYLHSWESTRFSFFPFSDSDNDGPLGRGCTVPTEMPWQHDVQGKIERVIHARPPFYVHGVAAAWTGTHCPTDRWTGPERVRLRCGRHGWSSTRQHKNDRSVRYSLGQSISHANMLPQTMTSSPPQNSRVFPPKDTALQSSIGSTDAPLGGLRRPDRPALRRS